MKKRKKKVDYTAKLQELDKLNLEKRLSDLHSVPEHTKRRHRLIDKATPTEILFRDFLDLKAIKFKFQHVVKNPLGFYILDFYLPKYRVGVEINGSSYEGREIYDAVRDSIINARGIPILRIASYKVKSIQIKPFLARLLEIKSYRKCRTYIY